MRKRKIKSDLMGFSLSNCNNVRHLPLTEGDTGNCREPRVGQHSRPEFSMFTLASAPGHPSGHIAGQLVCESVFQEWGLCWGCNLGGELSADRSYLKPLD